MINDKTKISGQVRATVYDKDGNIKRRPRTWFQKLFGLPGSLMVSKWHNIVTDYGDALIADLMANTPAKQKLDNLNAFVEVGTAWSATNPKQQNAGCHTPTGARKGMQATYPKVKGAFAAADDNVIQYQAIFPAASLSATINEAALLNASVSGECLAYGHISPDAVVTSSDSLQIDWAITFTGA